MSDWPFSSMWRKGLNLIKTILYKFYSLHSSLWKSSNQHSGEVCDAYINFTSRFDPLPRKGSVFGASILSRKITSCQDDVWFFNTSRIFYIILNLATHGNRLLDDLQLLPLREVSSSNECMCKTTSDQCRTKRRSLSSRMVFYTT